MQNSLERSVLGALETKVLGSLRDLEEAPAARVRADLAKRGTRVAYTTVATILGRLWSKGLVRRRRETCRGGERYVYRYAPGLEHRYLSELVKGVVRMFGPTGVVHLNQELSKLHPEEERDIRRRLGIE